MLVSASWTILEQRDRGLPGQVDVMVGAKDLQRRALVRTRRNPQSWPSDGGGEPEVAQDAGPQLARYPAYRGTASSNQGAGSTAPAPRMPSRGHRAGSASKAVSNFIATRSPPSILCTSLAMRSRSSSLDVLEVGGTARRAVAARPAVPFNPLAVGDVP